MSLVNEKTGETVKEGDILVDFRGINWEFISLSRGNTRVYVNPGPDNGSFAREFFVQVFPGYKITR